MVDTRELFFECSMTSGRQRTTALVRAWNAAEAAIIFKEQLAEQGLAGRGTIDVIAWTAHREPHHHRTDRPAAP
jgi:hypothetical protein